MLARHPHWRRSNFVCSLFRCRLFIRRRTGFGEDVSYNLLHRWDSSTSVVIENNRSNRSHTEKWADILSQSIITDCTRSSTSILGWVPNGNVMAIHLRARIGPTLLVTNRQSSSFCFRMQATLSGTLVKHSILILLVSLDGDTCPQCLLLDPPMACNHEHTDLPNFNRVRPVGISILIVLYVP